MKDIKFTTEELDMIFGDILIKKFESERDEKDEDVILCESILNKVR